MMHREKVRQALVLNPRASYTEIKSLLENDMKNPIALDVGYIAKIAAKIRLERHHRYDKTAIAERLAQIEDTTEMVVTNMWRILLDPRSDSKARVQAGKIIIDSQHQFLEAQMNAGIFPKQVGTLSVEHSHSVRDLPPEVYDRMLRAFENHGIIRPANAITVSGTETAPANAK